MSFFKKLFGLSKRRTKRRSRPGNYLIQFRFQGYAKKYANELSKDISQKFYVNRVARRGKPAHITLYGAFSTSDEKKVKKDFVSICKRFDLIQFKLSGFDHIDKRVIHLKVDPSPELVRLRSELAKELNKDCTGQDWDDPEKDFIFHATLAFRDIEEKFDGIWDYVSRLEVPDINQHLLRVTLLKQGRILGEYDLIQRAFLYRHQALSWANMQKTITALKEIKDNQGKRIEVHLIETPSVDKKIFFISDLHLDHANIIEFTKRPFKNVTEMNETLVSNWNNTVSDKDTVYFLGDMAFGKGSRSADYWLTRLNGRIVFIEGNHEDAGLKTFYSKDKNVFLTYKGKEFLLTHDPALKPKDWNGWIIHGHHHNNQPDKFPLINKKNKTINVSAELAHYTPIEIDKLLSQADFR